MKVILRYTGIKPIPQKDIDFMVANMVSILDSTEKMLVIEAPKEFIDSFIKQNPNWKLFDIKYYETCK